MEGKLINGYLFGYSSGFIYCNVWWSVCLDSMGHKME